MRKYHKWINESVWFATVNYLDDHSEKFPIKVSSNHLPTKTGFMNATLFTMRDAHFAAFGQAGFGVKNILLARRDIRFCIRSRTWELI